MKVSYGTDVGIVRSNNQDSLYTHMFSKTCGLFIVADGMGGHRGGKTASSIAIETVSEIIKNGFDKKLSSEDIRLLMTHAVKEANKIIFEKSCADEELSGMGTTIVVMLVINKTLYTVSVGDSRVYVCTKERLFRITTDHSLVANLVSKGIITEEEAKVHPHRNVITRAVGTDTDIEVDYFETPINKNDILVACSDGLHNLVSDDEITKATLTYDDELSSKLISMANERGGNDNVTVITVKIS